ncbi:MAG: hypothetical protein GY807_15750 [Gammaproteobacteria bacterium]|nr:hypothetical protein [Gammaproteobacteria bacterium]
MNEHQEQRLRDLYQLSRKEQPSTTMDKRIRQAAQGQIASRRNKWVRALSTAAVVVLSFSIVLDLTQQQPELTESDDIPVTERPETEAIPMEEEVMFDMMAPPAMPAATEIASEPEPEGQTGISDREAISPFIKFSETLKRDQKSDFADQVAPLASHTKNLSFEMSDDGIIIPTLPTTLDALLAINKSVTGKQLDNGDIEIFAGNRRILRLSHNYGVQLFTAWPGAERLEVEVNWQIGPESMFNCSYLGSALLCQWTKSVSASFRNNQLESVSWPVELR